MIARACTSVFGLGAKSIGKVLPFILYCAKLKTSAACNGSCKSPGVAGMATCGQVWRLSESSTASSIKQP